MAIYEIFFKSKTPSGNERVQKTGLTIIANNEADAIRKAQEIRRLKGLKAYTFKDYTALKID